VLPDGVIQHNFLQKWCNFTCLCAWVSEGTFPGGATRGFFQTFFYGGPKMVIWFLPLEIKKKAFFAEIFKFLPLFGHPYACV